MLVSRVRRRARDETGALMVITALLMTSVIAIAAYALDTSVWFVHHNHLQTQADAAALAAGQALQCQPGQANPTVDATVSGIVHQYDGYTSTNQQVWQSPTASVANPSRAAYSASTQNLFSVINRPNYFNQSTPADTDLSGNADVDGSPCQDGAVDVKLTESNLQSMIPFINPSYINAQARVTLKQLSQAVGAEPFAEPFPNPSSITATLGSTSATLHPSPTDPSTLIGTASIPAGTLTSSTGFSLSGENVNPAIYVNVTNNSGTPGQPTSTPVAPQADTITVSPGASNGCPSGPTGVFSNFVSSSTSCTVQVTATNVVFASGSGAPAISCSDAGLTLSVNGGAASALTCPTATPLNGKTWTSGPITIAPNSGITTLTLGWQLTAGNRPVGGSGGANGGNHACSTSKPCTGTIGSQQIASGAYDSITANTSGPVLGVNVIDANTGGELMSVPSGYSTTVTITVKVVSFTDSSTVGSGPTLLSFGGNQANAALECNGSSAGSPQLQANIATGCSGQYQVTNGSCPNSDSPPSCATENPGNGKLDKDLDPGMNQRVNGGATTCQSPNHWIGPNSVNDIVSQSPTDPRLILLLVTDNGALTNGAQQVPIRGFATFYVTGWAGDPCIGYAGPSNNALAATGDDDPGSKNTGVLYGHFVYQTVPGGFGTQPCPKTAFVGDCTPVLTK